MKTAVDWAVKMTKCSPDSLEITKEGMNMASYDSMGDTEVAVQVARHPRSASLLSGANCREGLESFNEVLCFPSYFFTFHLHFTHVS